MPEVNKNRSWVKNAAIIFLCVMLVLTFFSNTILNRSLPEVSGQYAGYGMISTGIRGTGTVSAVMSYNVYIGETRHIKEVLIRQGDMVAAGQTLFLLENEESEELAAARRTLEDMEYSYRLKVLQNPAPDYTDQENEIKRLEANLEKALLQVTESLKNKNALIEAEKAYKSAEDAALLLSDRLSELNDILAKIEAGESSAENIAELYEKFAAASDKLLKAQEALDECTAKVNEIQSQMPQSYESAYAAYESAARQYDSAYTEYMYQQQDYNTLVARYNIYNNAKSACDAAKAALDALDSADPGYDDALAAYNQAKAALDALTYVSENEVTSAGRSLERAYASLNYQGQELSRLAQVLQTLGPIDTQLSIAKKDEKAAKENVAKIQAELKGAKTLLDAAKAAASAPVKAEVKTLTPLIEAADKALAAALKVKNEAAAAYTITYEQAEENVYSLQNQLGSARRSLDRQKATDELNGEIKDLELARDKKAIDEQRAVVERLEANRADAVVTAKYSGVVMNVNCYPGEKKTPNDILAAINIQDKGYTMEITVTPEQSRQLKVGDAAKVNNYWWGDIKVIITAIKANVNNPGQSMVVEFSVTGSVTAGQSLDVTIGERQTGYNLVVPNSAVHEDSNGNFILTASVKNTPLGNRYIAKRIDVIVLAKDSYNTAVDAGTSYSYEYVITTSAKPIEAGMQIRLAEGN